MVYAWRGEPGAGRVPPCQTPAGQSLVPAVRARARAVRVAAARARRPRIAARPSTAHAGAPGRPDPRPPGPSPARAAVETEDSHKARRARGLLKPISPRDVRYSVGSEGASACGSTASRAVCSSSMNSRKALLRAKDSLPSK